MGKGCLNDQQVTELVKIVDKIMKDHDKRQMARHGNLPFIFYAWGDLVGNAIEDNIKRKLQPN